MCNAHAQLFDIAFFLDQTVDVNGLRKLSGKSTHCLPTPRREIRKTQVPTLHLPVNNVWTMEIWLPRTGRKSCLEFKKPLCQNLNSHSCSPCSYFRLEHQLEDIDARWFVQFSLLHEFKFSGDPVLFLFVSQIIEFNRTALRVDIRQIVFDLLHRPTTTTVRLQEKQIVDFVLCWRIEPVSWGFQLGRRKPWIILVQRVYETFLKMTRIRHLTVPGRHQSHLLCSHTACRHQ